MFYRGREGASIGQTGQVPSEARSLLYFATGPLQVIFNGQALFAVPLSDRGKYVIYGADIGNYAGQTGQLTFIRPWSGGSFSSGTTLDSIRFSPNVIPEPSIASLSAAACVLWALGCRSKRKMQNPPEALTNGTTEPTVLGRQRRLASTADAGRWASRP